MVAVADRTISALVVPWNSWEAVDETLSECFVEGAFSESILGGAVRVCLEHRWSYVLARQRDDTLRFSSDAKGLRASIVLPDDGLGALTLDRIRSGRYRGISVRFKAIEEDIRDRGGARLRLVSKADLQEISICETPVYRGTKIVVPRPRLRAN